MRAIVLTCDNFHAITNHMIHAYNQLWPDHPFIFRVPYNGKYPLWLKEKYVNSIELVKTDSEIKKTVIQLLEDIDSDIVYWCLDDKYPVWVDVDSMNEIYQHILESEEIEGISFIYKRSHLRKVQKDVYIGKIRLFEKKGYRKIFQHQYIRKHILRKFFEDIPEVDHAKQMDWHVKKIEFPYKHMYAIKDNIIFFRESMKKGKILDTCAESFRFYGLEVPDLETTNYHKRLYK